MVYSFDHFDNVLDSLSSTIDSMNDLGYDLIDIVEQALENSSVPEQKAEYYLEKLDISIDHLGALGDSFLDLVDSFGDTDSLSFLNSQMTQPVVVQSLNQVLDGLAEFTSLIVTIQNDSGLSGYQPIQDALAIFDTILSGFDDVDFLAGNKADDVMLGGTGSDLLNGLGGDDVISGEDGDDIACGMNGDDVLKGGAGDDVLTGLADNDILTGGAGGDVLIAGSGNDKVAGGADSDLFVCGQGAGKVVVKDFDGSIDIFGVAFTAEFGALDIEGRKGSAFISFEGDVLAKLNDTEVKEVTSANFASVV